MSLVEIPASYRADWKGHYAQNRARIDSVAAIDDTGLRNPKIHAIEKKRRAEEDRERRIQEAVKKSANLVAATNEMVELAKRKVFPTILEIQEVICSEYNVSRIDLISARRTAEVVFPRQIAMHVAKRLTTKSLPEIGKHFGGRDHTTILHGVRKIEARRGANAALDARITKIEAVILARRAASRQIEG